MAMDINVFLTKDRMGFGAGDLQLYRYAGNGFTNGTDPSGMETPDASAIRDRELKKYENQVRDRKLTIANHRRFLSHPDYRTDPKFVETYHWNERHYQQKLNQAEAQLQAMQASSALWTESKAHADKLALTELHAKEQEEGSRRTSLARNPRLAPKSQPTETPLAVFKDSIRESLDDLSLGVRESAYEKVQLVRDLGNTGISIGSHATDWLLDTKIYQYDLHSNGMIGYDAAQRDGNQTEYLLKSIRSGATLGVYDLAESGIDAAVSGDSSKFTKQAGGFGFDVGLAGVGGPKALCEPLTLRKSSAATVRLDRIIAETKSNLSANPEPIVRQGTSFPKNASQVSQPKGLGLSDANSLKIQRFADKHGVEVQVVGSRAAGTAEVLSDFDYIIVGGNSKVRSAARRELPRGLGGGEQTPSGWSGLDVFDGAKNPLDTARPHVIFKPQL